jgi:hypothetical protein
MSKDGDENAERTGPAAGARPARRADDDEPVLPDVTGDESGVGWGDDRGERDDDWYRRERPPHHE